MFFKGTTRLRDFNYGKGAAPYADAQVATTDEFSVVAGDLCFVAVFGYEGNADAAPTGSGQSEIDTLGNGAIGEKTAASTGTTTMQGYGGYPGVVGFAFDPSVTPLPAQQSERTGDVLTYADAVNEEITVPADATFVIAAYAMAGVYTPVTNTLGGQTFTLLERQNFSGGRNGEAGVFILANPPTGARQLVLNPCCQFVAFLRNTVGIRDYAKGITEASWGTDGLARTADFDVVAGDLCHTVIFGYSSDADAGPGGSGQTMIAGNLGSTSYALGEKVALTTGGLKMFGYGGYVAVVGWSYEPMGGPSAPALVTRRVVTRGLRVG